MEEKKGSNTKPLFAVSKPADLSEFFSLLHRPAEREEFLDTAVEKMGSFFEAEGIEIHLLDDSSGSWMLKGHKGLSSRFLGSGIIQPGDGWAGRIADTGKAVYTDTRRPEKSAELIRLQKEGFLSYAGIPIAADGIRVGVLGLYYRAFREFSRDEKIVLSETGKQLGQALKNIGRYEQAVQKAQRLIGISRAMAVTRQLSTLDRVLDDIAKILVSALGFDLSWIGLVSDDGTQIEGRAGFGAGMKRALTTMVFPIVSDPDQLIGQAFRSRSLVQSGRIEKIPPSPLKSWLEALHVRSGGAVPIQSGDRIIGIIGCFFAADHPFDEEDSRMLTSVSEQASIAIENSKLYEQVKTSEERYRMLFESTGTSMAIVDPRGHFKLVNRAFEQLSGYTSRELTDNAIICQFFMKKGKPDRCIRPHQRWEEEFIDRNRDIKQVYVITAPISQSDDILVSLADMTRQRDLEKRLFESQELASLGELSAGIAHEIRNPLIAINTSVSILKDEQNLSPEGQQVLDVVKEETDHLAAIVNDFLKYARPKLLTLEKEDLNRLVQDALKRIKDQAGEKIVWIERYDDTLPPMELDRHQMLQVFANLLSNSIDAMPEGGKLFIETVYQSGKKDNRVLIVFKDTGMGIQSDLLAKIFLPFFSTKEKGTGMGLAICRRIVNQHNGEIFVESEPGKGAVFSVMLPLETKPAEKSE